MWGGFVIKKIILQFVVANTAVANRENYGSQKMNLIIHVKKKSKDLGLTNLRHFLF